MCDSGIEEFPAVTLADLVEAMPAIAATGLPLLAHAELVPDDGSAPDWNGSERSHAAWAETRPAWFEHEAVRALVELAIAVGCRVHVVHVSSVRSIEILHDLLRDTAGHTAVAEPVDVLDDESRGPTRRYATFSPESVTYETCPHYLLLAAEDVPDGATQFKCAPPLRSAAEIEALWTQVLRDVPAIVSDHSPAPPKLKDLESGSFATAWGGVASLGLQLPLIATALHERGLERAQILQFLATSLCQRPAELAGLAPERGAIIPGAAADLAIFDLDDKWTITGERAGWRWPLTPYEGRPVRGRVQATYVNGAARFLRA
ncbi:MAG: amidohydrolase family protein, partial [Thermoleophilia bacterium]|nr:amidohydrolase family protein [Thermoleophilia bacterium]